MKHFKICALICSLVFIVTAFAACGNSGDGDSSAADGSKVLVIGSGQSAGTMDPVQAYDGWYAIRYGIGQTLTKMNDDMSISGWLVEDDYSANEDNTVWTFTVKDGVTFSNGTPLTAELVKASLENVYTNGERGPEYFTPASIEAEGQTLTVTLDEPEPILPNKLADPLFTIIDTTVDNSDIAESGPIGTGPFVMESFDSTTKECVVVKNENYWGGDVALDKIDFIYTEDQSNITMALQSGEFNAVYNMSMTDIGTFEEDDNYTIVSNASGRTTIGFMNFNGALGDIALRQAILRNLNKEEYCESLLNGQYIPGVTLLTSAADYGYDELTDPNSYDPEAAAKLLDDAGYKDTDGDGYRETPEGDQIDLRFVYYTGRPEQQIVVEATQTDMKKIGIKVTPEVHDTQTVMDMQQTGDYDLLCMSINMMNCGDPENQINTYFCEGGSYNATGYDSAEFNRLMKEVHVTADPEQRKDLVKQAEQVLLEDAVAIYYCYPIMNFVMQNGVENVYSNPADFYWVDENTDINEL
ncbi:MAG: ABC transporter substrate-binding protein [Bacillota bacterium]|jgi:peptide/nickel transport system substrate-binding protein